MDHEARSAMVSGLKAWGFEPSEAACARLLRHLELLVEWNARVNLTAITTWREMAIKHVVDSAAVKLTGIELAGARIMDVGSGGGFPGGPLGVLYELSHVTFVESVQKKCRFLELVGQGVLGGRYQVLWGRAEELGQRNEYRGRFDVVVARAVADMAVLAELCLPFVRVGGSFVAMKGPGAQSDKDTWERALQQLGGRRGPVTEYQLPEGLGARCLIHVEKERETPRQYPRRPGVPQRRPLV